MFKYVARRVTKTNTSRHLPTDAFLMALILLTDWTDFKRGLLGTARGIYQLQLDLPGELTTPQQIPPPQCSPV